MKICVIGGGLMGRGIAEVAARGGIETIVIEVNRERARSAQQAIEASLDRAVASGKLDAPARERASARLAFSDQLGDVAVADAAIEAITEDEDAKRRLIVELDRLLPGVSFIASNTSSVPIMKLAAATTRPERVLGLHFFNPVPVMGLVEVVRSITTSDDAVTAARDFVAKLDKQCIDAGDRAGFVVNALLIPYLLSAIRMYESGFASREDIDRGMVIGCAHPMGPLALADLIGLDTLLYVAESLHSEFRDAASVAPPLLSRMVDGGLLGRKTGQGFYAYAGLTEPAAA
jgi:3-hydroxybutyryl-CoA dehydrogenase